MITQEEIQEVEQQATDLAQKLKELKETYAEQEKPLLWKCDSYREYYTINSAERIDCYDFNSTFDASNQAAYNAFKTSPQAKTANKKLKLPRLLAKLFAEHCPDYEPDWDESVKKYYFYWDHATSMLYISDNWKAQSVGTVYFPKDVAEKLRPKLQQMIKDGELL